MCTSNGRCGFLIAPDCISNRSSVCQVSQTLPNEQVVWTKNAFNHNSLRLGHAPSNASSRSSMRVATYSSSHPIILTIFLESADKSIKSPYSLDAGSFHSNTCGSFSSISLEIISRSSCPVVSMSSHPAISDRFG